MPKAKLNRLYLIPILSKAFDVIELLEKHRALNVEDVHHYTNISKTSVYRILQTLAHRGYVARTPAGLYRLVSHPRRLHFGLAVQSADLPFSNALAQSVGAAAADAGIELLTLDNHFDPEIALRNAEEFVARRVDLVLECQVEEAVGPHVSNILKKAEIPLIAIDVPHPNATYFGVDNFEAGREAGVLLVQHALRAWKGKVDRVIGVGFGEAGSFVQSRISGAFDAIRENFPALQADSFFQIEGRGMREASRQAMTEFLQLHRGNGPTLVATTTDSSALGILDVVRRRSLEHRFAIVGQDCIPEAVAEICSGTGAFIGSISHTADIYGPRLIQLGISLLRGFAVPPYNYVPHRAITRETLTADVPSPVPVAS